MQSSAGLQSILLIGILCLVVHLTKGLDGAIELNELDETTGASPGVTSADDEGDDLGENLGVGRRGGALLSTTGSFVLSSNRAGNSERAESSVLREDSSGSIGTKSRRQGKASFERGINWLGKLKKDNITHRFRSQCDNKTLVDTCLRIARGRTKVITCKNHMVKKNHYKKRWLKWGCKAEGQVMKVREIRLFREPRKTSRGVFGYDTKHNFEDSTHSAGLCRGFGCDGLKDLTHGYDKIRDSRELSNVKEESLSAGAVDMVMQKKVTPRNCTNAEIDTHVAELKATSLARSATGLQPSSKVPTAAECKSDKNCCTSFDVEKLCEFKFSADASKLVSMEEDRGMQAECIIL